MTNNSDNPERGAVATADDQHERDSALIAKLFEAGQQKELSSDVVLDVLVEALKTGRNVKEIVDDQEILSRRQRESVQRFVSEQTRNSAERRSTVANARQSATSVDEPTNQTSDATRLMSDQQKFVEDHDAALPSGAERYADAEEIGRGGWGVVVRAHDRQLNRDVAVKKLGQRASGEADIAKRFLHEARITGQLQHPGIVPVYERGVSLDDRQPFYAMKLLDGVTLRDVIRDYHEAETGREKREQFHILLNRFVDVCQAIAYAHSKDIIHRDLKPSNVVVGEFGETVVVDWGLAKNIKEDNVVFTEETVRAGTPMPSPANDSAGQLGGLLDPVVTQVGSVIGTPAFMAPEQASGSNAQIDTRSDTYALGVMLYVILTGQPPFRGNDVQTTLKQVLEGEYKHPKLVDRSVPAPLASICTKAMSMAQKDRYQTASEIADDVLHYLANEPVSAHRDSLLERASRWCRRHPTIATTTIAGAVILATTSSIATAVVSKARSAEKTAKEAALVARDHETTARQQAEAAKKEALRRLEESRTAADQWLIGLSGTLQRFPGMQPIRQDLIKQAQKHYLKLFDSVSNNPDLKLEAARCLIRLGDLQLMDEDQLEDRTTAAEGAFNGGASILSTIAASDHPKLIDREKLNAKIGLILCAIERGDFQADRADELRQVVTELKAHRGTQNSDDLRSCLARAFLVLGRGYESASDHSSAIEAFESALEWTKLFDDPHLSSRQHLTSTVREDLARVYSLAGLHSRAARILQDHIEFNSDQLSNNPQRPDILESRAIKRMLWANEQRHLGDDWAAENAYRAAVDDLSDSWQLMFGDHFYSENLAVAQANLGQLAIRLNRTKDAEKMLRSAVEQLTGLMQSGHADRETASRLAACNVSLGHVLVLTGNPAAEETIKRSIDIFEYLKRESTVNAGDQLAHGRAIANLGRWYIASGDDESATTWLKKSVEHFDAIAVKDSGPELQQSAALAKFDLSNVLHAAGQANESEQHRREGIEILKALSAAESPERKTQSDSATVSLIERLVDVDGDEVRMDTATRMLSDMDITAGSPGHIHQLVAIARYRFGDLPAAMDSIDRAHAARRYPNAIDHAVRGCILASLKRSGPAQQSLDHATMAAADTPGDQRLIGWIDELGQSLESLQPDSNSSAQ